MDVQIQTADSQKQTCLAFCELCGKITSVTLDERSLYGDFCEAQVRLHLHKLFKRFCDQVHLLCGDGGFLRRADRDRATCCIDLASPQNSGRFALCSLNMQFEYDWLAGGAVVDVRGRGDDQDADYEDK